MTNSPCTSVRTLDIRNFINAGPTERAEFSQNLRRCFEEIGFVVLTGHPISAELQNKAYRVIGEFFALPENEKLKYETHGTGGARGYTRLYKEHAKNTGIGDLKEFFHVGMDIPPGHPLSKVYPQNVSVPQVKEFDQTLRNLYSDLLDLGREVLKAIAISFELEEDFFEDFVIYGDSKLRPIHYPPLTGTEVPGAVRSSAHEDINLITLLIGASSPGLQVLNTAGQWLEITTQPHEIVVNVGDMLQRLTNYKLRSTTHRVVNPPQHLAGTTRFSIPFFLHPIPEMSLAPLKNCVSAALPPRDPATTAGEYLAERLREIGLT